MHVFHGYNFTVEKCLCNIGWDLLGLDPWALVFFHTLDMYFWIKKFLVLLGMF